ncbi:MAG: 30S ribosomal protein S8 [bacterium]|nr:30S ribosomal protein S8 [bacterium]
MSRDIIGDMLTAIRNGYSASKEEVVVPHSKLREEVAKKLVGLGYLTGVQVNKEGKFKELDLQLKYEDGKPVLTKIRRVSRPGLRTYRGKKEIKKVLSGLGFSIMSTPKGILSGAEARKMGIGGEVICEGW